MADVFSKERRSEIMRNITPRDSSTELYVRSLVHRLGFRFRLHVRELPGKPDIVLPRLQKIILVNGCFWHSHRGCKKSSIPKSNIDFWKTKLLRNAARDRENRQMLTKLGWEVLTVWQCQLRKPEQLREKIQSFLRSGRRARSR